MDFIDQVFKSHMPMTLFIHNGKEYKLVNIERYLGIKKYVIHCDFAVLRAMSITNNCDKRKIIENFDEIFKRRDKK